MGGTYHEENEYLIPNLTLLPEKEKPIGIWGQRNKRYLKEHRKATCTTLLTNGTLNTYLADIDEQTQAIMEQLKAENALEWTGRMNNIRAWCWRL